MNHTGQLYTIEGVAAGLIMLLTAFIVVGTTSVYTPGDTHISDMQLEQLGGDALHMMNIPNTSAASAARLIFHYATQRVERLTTTFSLAPTSITGTP